MKNESNGNPHGESKVASVQAMPAASAVRMMFCRSTFLQPFFFLLAILLLFAAPQSIDAAERFKLTAEFPQNNDQFGQSVDVSGDFAIVGAHNSQSAYLFDVNTGEQLQHLTGSNGFATDVAIDGDLAVVGDYINNRAYVFDVESGDELFPLVPDDPFAPNGTFVPGTGDFVAVSGKRAIISGWWSDVAYVFDLNTGDQLYKFAPPIITPSPDENLGWNLDVAISGDTAVVGYNIDDEMGPNTGAVFHYDLTNGNLVSKITASDAGVTEGFGSPIAVDNNIIVTGTAERTNGFRQDIGYIVDLTSETEIGRLETPPNDNVYDCGAHLDVNGKSRCNWIKWTDSIRRCRRSSWRGLRL